MRHSGFPGMDKLRGDVARLRLNGEGESQQPFTVASPGTGLEMGLHPAVEQEIPNTGPILPQQRASFW